MTLQCPQCLRLLDFTGERPSFCAYCGRPLAGSSLPPTEPGTPFSPNTPADIPTIAYQSPSPDAAQTVTLLRALDRVAGYQLLRTLGQGGMGTVYEAEESASGRRVALKLLSPDIVSSPEAVERFRQEGRLASAVSHPRCVFVLAADEEAGRPYIVMELMPGRTLADLVRKEGPRPAEEAIARVLDVVDGLLEAHRLGVIHRDVKPSNCFLDGDGRVKVGDFGLSRSLSVDSNLTRTGAFLGTPLYASPEQIRGDPLDPRTDVYSTAATLYFLLTGRAPFEHRDAAATMARIVSEPAPSPRNFRPELAAELERVILRGLERDRDRRYRDLEEFREALLPLLPKPATAAPPGLRLGAWIFDFLLLLIPSLSFVVLVDADWRSTLVDAVMMLAYFGVLEATWGASLGKRIAGLRVYAAESVRPASPRRVLLRTAIFTGILEVPSVLTDLIELLAPRSLPDAGLVGGLVGGLVLACAALATTMRRSNGYRGLHELASGTRVVRLPRQGRRRSAERRRKIGRDRGVIRRPVGVMESIGPYRVRGAVRWEADRKVLAGEDSSLGREVWVVLRPRRSPPLSPRRQELARSSRPRWLTGGEQSEGRWDAYLAPAGMPLVDLAGLNGLGWHDVRPILEDMAEELAAACQDDTLPTGLTVEQVWVEPDGRVQLVDPLGAAADDGDADPQARALDLLARIAAVGLEGGQRRLDERPTTIRAAVPFHARAMLDRLLGGPSAYRTVEEFRADLAATRDLPTELSLSLRAMGLGINAGLMLPALLVAYGTTYAYLEYAYPMLAAGGADDERMAALAIRYISYGLATAVPIASILWSGLTRGGFSKSLLGMGLVRHDGPIASRLRCFWRALVATALPWLLLIACLWVRDTFRFADRLPWGLWWASLVLTALHLPLALLNPRRGLHDWLAGTRVVPK